ncbi:class I SAM-dependent methyltransferase [Virgibacillus byunsanensis]|uniref:Class I SAM-dependent methyltransferase n=1 Tax=Virgibacillus byunsanensis TaxID=570945 RepID=A0ABW3LPZ7_9BACI
MAKEHWNNRFSEDDFVYGEEENVFINKMSYLIPEQSNIGCFAEGEGRNAVYLSRLGHDVTAFDLSTVGLEKTKTLAKKNSVNVETVALDLTKEKAGANQYDAAVMVFGHIPKTYQQFMIEGMIESVKPGGYIIFEVYSDAQLMYKTGGPPTLKYLYDPIDVLSWILPYTCIHFYYGEAERNEGSRHTGLGHVIQAVIKK